VTDRYFVICYNRDEFKRFIDYKSLELWSAGQTSVSLSHFIYVSGAETIRGYRNPHGWFYGRWKQREDIANILATLLISSETINPVVSKLYQERCKKTTYYTD